MRLWWPTAEDLSYLKTVSRLWPLELDFGNHLAPPPYFMAGNIHTQREQVNFLKHTARPLIATLRKQKYSLKPKWFQFLLNLRPGKIKEPGCGQTPRLSGQWVISLSNRLLPLQNGAWHLLMPSWVCFSASWRFDFKIQWQVCQLCILHWGAFWDH